MMKAQKQTNMCVHTYRDRERERQRGRWFILCVNLSWFSGLQTGWDVTIDYPGSWAFGLGLDLPHSFPGPPTCRWQMEGFLSLHNQVSQFLATKLFLYIYILLVLFLWRTLDNTKRKGERRGG